MATQTPVRGVEIIGRGGIALPRLSVTNQELIDRYDLDSSDEWIRQKVGIERRHIIGPDESLVTLGVEAGHQALIGAGIEPPVDMDKLFLATSTSGTYREIPGAHPSIHRGLVERGYTFRSSGETNSACTGFVTALLDAYRYFAVDGIHNALVIGSDTLSKKTNYRDRSTGILFGDGAGAVVLQRNEQSTSGLVGW
jgi:3-oxoacyl-[acyl-carrier-protein] synthase-3